MFRERERIKMAQLGSEKNRMKSARLGLMLIVVYAIIFLCLSLPTQAGEGRLEDIKHIIVIYPENRSFDNLYGLFPGANGIAQAKPEQYIQVDHDGTPFATSPPVWREGKEREKKLDPAFPAKGHCRRSHSTNLVET